MYSLRKHRSVIFVSCVKRHSVLQAGRAPNYCRLPYVYSLTSVTLQAHYEKSGFYTKLNLLDIKVKYYTINIFNISTEKITKLLLKLGESIINLLS